MPRVGRMGRAIWGLRAVGCASGSPPVPVGPRRASFFRGSGQRWGGLCGPILLWDWFVLDVSYLLVLVGGSLVLRARMAGAPTWVAFGSLGVLVGAFLFAATYGAQVAVAQAAPSAMDVVTGSVAC